MKKTIFAVIFILILAACSDSGSNGGSSSESKNVATGTDGITFSFSPNNPPSSIRGSKLSVAVEYYNKGTHPVSNLVFYLHGYDPSILFGGQVKSFSSPKIEGKNEYNKIGSQSYFAQWETSINKPNGEGQFPQQLFVTACYGYKTIAEPSICIDPNQDDVSSDYAGKCSFSVQGLGSSQGAPIAVTSVKQSIADGIIYLEIVVENKGKGSPFPLF
ncbi:MAG: hypothetical protein HGA85_04080, partial [Nanoarchaeota archaeon]|nr:hypothetical protein [Nanoarchaeota archaeon]